METHKKHIDKAKLVECFKEELDRADSRLLDEMPHHILSSIILRCIWRLESEGG